MNANSQLQKNNKCLEKKYVATVTERDEVNSSCNRLAGEIKDLEVKLKNAEHEIASWTSKFQVSRMSTTTKTAENLRFLTLTSFVSIILLKA